MTFHIKNLGELTCPETRRSVTNFFVYFCASFISWRSKKQLTISRSFFEAEYKALAATTCELQWLMYILHDLRLPIFNHLSSIMTITQPFLLFPTKSFMNEPNTLKSIFMWFARNLTIHSSNCFISPPTNKLFIFSPRLYLLPPSNTFFPSWKWRIFIPSLRGL